MFLIFYVFISVASSSETRVMFAEGEHLDKSFRRSTLERGAIEGNSPVLKKTFMLLVRYLEYCRE